MGSAAATVVLGALVGLRARGNGLHLRQRRHPVAAGLEAVLERFRVDGQVAIVTGAGKGIGAASAVALAEAGADVVVSARTEADLEQVAARVRALGRRAVVHPADVNDLDELARLVDRTVDELGGLDILVSNAGGSISKPLLATTVDDLERSFHFNVSVAFELTRLAVAPMLARGGGAVVTIGSMAGVHAARGLAHAQPHEGRALAQLTRLMAAELSPRIRRNSVLPGAVETESLRWWLSSQPDDVRASMAARTAMRRLGDPDDIAAAVLYLATPASAWVTGKLLEVDGSASPDLVPRDVADL